jgi:hypothetical protein
MRQGVIENIDTTQKKVTVLLSQFEEFEELFEFK